MNWDEAKNTWQTSGNTTDATRALQGPTAVGKLWAKVTRRDRLETVAAILMMPVFGYELWRAANKGDWVSVAFLVVIIAALIAIPLKLRHTRRLRPAADPQMSVVQFLNAEHAALKAQAKQARRAWLWYVLPIAIGAAGFYTSVVGFNWQSAGYATIVAIVGAAIHAFNYYGAAPRFERTAADLKREIRQLEDTPS